MQLAPSSWVFAFPMARAGGLFILLMGFSGVCGTLLPGRRRLLLIVGGAVATITMLLSAARLSAPFGVPSRLQLWFLFGSIGVEVILIRAAVALYRHAGERSLLLAILFAVGLHFLPMSIALGPLCTALGVTLCLCAGGGLWWKPGLSLNRLWALDGLVKMTYGAIMLIVPSIAAGSFTTAWSVP